MALHAELATVGGGKGGFGICFQRLVANGRIREPKAAEVETKAAGHPEEREAARAFKTRTFLPKGMLSVLSYGRLVARAVLGGLSQTDGRDYSLISASYGFGKDFRKGILKKGMCYGDDACFIARNRNADVLGMTATLVHR